MNGSSGRGPQGDPVGDILATRDRPANKKGSFIDSFGEEIRFVVDAIQRVGLAEEIQGLPDTRFSIKWDTMKIGLKISISGGLLLVFLFGLQQLGSLLAYIIFGKSMLRYVIFGLFILLSLGVGFWVLSKVMFIASFAKDYIKGPRARQLWKWFIVGVYLGLPGVFFMLAVYEVFLSVMITKILVVHTTGLSTILTYAYRYLSPEQQIRAYEMAMKLYESADNPLLGLVKGIGIAGISAFLVSLLMYPYARKAFKEAAEGDTMGLGPEKRRVFN